MQRSSLLKSELLTIILLPLQSILKSGIIDVVQFHIDKVGDILKLYKELGGTLLQMTKHFIFCFSVHSRTGTLTNLVDGWSISETTPQHFVLRFAQYIWLAHWHVDIRLFKLLQFLQLLVFVAWSLQIVEVIHGITFLELLIKPILNTLNSFT